MPRSNLIHKFRKWLALLTILLLSLFCPRVPAELEAKAGMLWTQRFTERDGAERGDWYFEHQSPLTNESQLKSWKRLRFGFPFAVTTFDYAQDNRQEWYLRIEKSELFLNLILSMFLGVFLYGGYQFLKADRAKYERKQRELESTSSLTDN